MSVHYLLDGYNVIKQIPKWANLSLASGRTELYRHLLSQRPQGSPQNKVTIVFDSQTGSGGSEQHPGLEVIFSALGSADDKIKLLVQKARLKKNLVVVTDDRDIQYYVRALGAKVLGVKEFLGQAGGRQRRQARFDAMNGHGDHRRDRKEISWTLEQKINQEFQRIWLKPKSHAHEKNS